MTIAWVTGIKGFLGRHLAKRLSGQGVNTSGLDISSWTDVEAAEWGVSEFLTGDITTQNLDLLAAKTGAPDYIFHLAGGSSVGFSIQLPEEDFRRTVGSTVPLLEWVRVHSPHTRLVMSSSAAVYGSGYASPIAETAPLVPYSPYGYHKRMTELLFESYYRNYGLHTVVVRLFSVYGPELRKQLLWDVCVRLKEKPRVLELAGTGGEMRDWLHGRDAAAYMHIAIERASAGTVVNGGTGIAISVGEVVRELLNARGLDIQLSFSGKSRAGDPAYLVADATLGRSIGLLPTVDWRNGIREYAEWFDSVLGSGHP